MANKASSGATCSGPLIGTDSIMIFYICSVPLRPWRCTELLPFPPQLLFNQRRKVRGGGMGFRRARIIPESRERLAGPIHGADHLSSLACRSLWFFLIFSTYTQVSERSTLAFLSTYFHVLVVSLQVMARDTDSI